MLHRRLAVAIFVVLNAAAHAECPRDSPQSLAGKDLTGCNFNWRDLPARDFSSAKLIGAGFKESNLARATFRNATLGAVSPGDPPTSFTHADLIHADFSGAKLGASEFFFAKLSCTKWVEADISQVIFGPYIDHSTQCGAQPDFSRAILNCGFTGSWPHVKLDGADARRCGDTLRNKRLANVRMPGGRFDQLPLDGVDWSGSDMTGASFSGAKMKGFTPGGGRFDRAIFDDAVMDEANIAGINITDASFRNASMKQSNFTSAVVKRASFAGARLEKSSFDRATLTGSSFLRANLGGASFAGADLQSREGIPAANFDEAYLESASMTNAVLSNASFVRATLVNAKMTGATFAQNDFTGANLSGAVMAKGDLRGLTFTRASLVGADLSGARLSLSNGGKSTVLSEASLQGANLTGASLAGANLLNAAIATPSGVPLFIGKRDVGAAIRAFEKKRLTAAVSALFDVHHISMTCASPAIGAVQKGSLWTLGLATPISGPFGNIKLFTLTRMPMSIQVGGGAKGPIFSIKLTADDMALLDKGWMPEALLDQFADNKYMLPPCANPTITTEVKLSPDLCGDPAKCQGWEIQYALSADDMKSEASRFSRFLIWGEKSAPELTVYATEVTMMRRSDPTTLRPERVKINATIIPDPKAVFDIHTTMPNGESFNPALASTPAGFARMLMPLTPPAPPPCVPSPTTWCGEAPEMGRQAHAADR